MDDEATATAVMNLKFARTVFLCTFPSRAAATSNAALGWKVLFNGILGLVLGAKLPHGKRSLAKSLRFIFERHFLGM